MIKSPRYVVTDNHGQEILDDNSFAFDLYAYNGDIRQQPPGYIPSHWHRELEIFILLEGVVNVDIGMETYQLHAGEGCFINTSVLHAFKSDKPATCHFRSFVFGSELVSGMPGSIFDTAYVRPLIENGVPFLTFEKAADPVFFQEFDHAYAACNKEDYGYEIDVRDALSRILLYVKSKSADTAAPAISEVQENRLKDMLLWIDSHLNNTVTVSGVAGAANICTRECQRIFNQYLHYSPIEYLLRKRIFHAAGLISETDLPLTDIALNCGFSSPSYFTKQFHRLMGCTPSSYRKNTHTSWNL